MVPAQARRVQERPPPEQGPSLVVGVDDELEPGEAGRWHLGAQMLPVGVLDVLDPPPVQGLSGEEVERVVAATH